MNIVLLSGGSGKRLWPLSNDTQSKQFLKLLKNDRGEYESMVQRVARQIRAAQRDADIFVSCNAAQTDILQRQLAGAETIAEPSRRDTFPAIVLAAAHLRYNKQLGEDEAFIVCPIDVFAENRYFELLEEVLNLAASGRNKIGLMGVKPTYPSEKYGYILQRDGRVTGFVEKPDAGEAGRLIEGGALWNCGVFSLKLGYVLKQAWHYVKFDSFDGVYAKYGELPRISFDYEVVEKEDSIGAVTYDGVWKDLGTWNTLTEEMGDGATGRNVLISDSCKNTHVLNMLDIPVIAQDLTDAVVVASHDGILVSSKHGSSFLKPLAEQINLRPMYEQRRWGNYRVLDYKQSGSQSSLVKRMFMEAGKAISYQYHTERDEVWVIVSGKGILTVDGEDSAIGPGSVIKIRAQEKHTILAATDMEFIEVQLGRGELEEGDIIRVSE
jgi:mannose-1-phosphate guanylyltransferase